VAAHNQKEERHRARHGTHGTGNVGRTRLIELGIIVGRGELYPGAGVDDMRRVLTTCEVGSYCGVSRKQVVEWIDAGMLRATAVSDGWYRIAVEDFQVFLFRFGGPTD